MSYKLVIVESPSKCKKIEQFLNNLPTKDGIMIKYKCLASFGHIRELRGIESIDIHNNFAPTFTNCESKKEQIGKLKKAIKEANEVILASDDDREGEAIAWHLCQVFNLPIKTTKRILFHEITEPALHKAINNPSHINMLVVHAQMARQVLDMLVGYKLSPVLWQNVKDGLSAGRCQTPALRLIYENQNEIDKATGKQCYTITGYFTSNTIPFVLDREETEETAVQEFLKASVDHKHCYKECQLHTKVRAAPEPFSTSSMQQACSNDLHISPKETMSICQKLYEEGYITYPRTDSKTYSDEFLKLADAYIEETFGHESMRSESMRSESMRSESMRSESMRSESMRQHTTISAEEIKESAHEAIRVTHLECKNVEDVTDASRKKMDRVYQLIRRRTLESCMAAATVSVLLATITAPFNHTYHYTTEHIIVAGWKKVNKSAVDDNYYSYLQALTKNSIIHYKKIKANLHIKELKTHFSEARLVQLLEEKGIGRPSTFSSIVEKIQERKYVLKENIKGKLIKCVDYELAEKEMIKITLEKEFGNEKNKLIIQPVGIMALEFLLEHFDVLFQYSYTKQMEEDLDLVAKGEKVWHDVCRTCCDELEQHIAAMAKRGKERIRIDDNHTYMIGKWGPVIKVGGAAPQTPRIGAGASGVGVGASGADTSREAGTREAGGVGGAAPQFRAVKKDIDLNKLRRGEYTLEDILEKNDVMPSIGLYKEKPVYIKVGKFGKYLEWNGITHSLKHIKQPVDEITLEDVLEIVYDLHNEDGDGSGSNTNNKSGILRVISVDASIRKGKGNYGNYIFYKNNKMKKPRFLKLDGFTGNYLTCELSVLQEWFKRTYDV
jgi:DNA topoisomerase-1